MEHHNTSLTSGTTSQKRIPTAVWVLLAAAIIGLLAIFVFKVAVSTVFTYGFLGLMVFSHLFMHGGHGSHGGHTDQTNSQISDGTQTDQYKTHSRHDPANSQVDDDPQTDQDKTHAGQGGCH